MTISKICTLLWGAIICLCPLNGQAEQQNPANQNATTTQDPQVIEQVGDLCDGFTLTTRFDKAVFKDGEPVKVAFRLKNLRPTMEYFSRQRDVRDFDLKVTATDGKPISLTEYGRIIYNIEGTGSSVNIKMKQGDEVSGTLHVNRIYDMSQGGNYNITVSTRAPTTGTIVTSKTTSIKVTFDG